MAAGRPSEYKPEYCERVIELGRLGMSVVEMASDIGVSRNTLETSWTAAHPEFLEALEIARECSQSWWESMGRVNLIMPKEAGTFQASVWSRSMAARFPKDWRENKGVELTGKDGGPVQIKRAADMTDDELALIAQGGK
jgi:hypothetical protein